MRALLARIREAQAAQHPQRPLGAFVFPSTTSPTGHLVEIKRSWAALKSMSVFTIAAKRDFT